VLFDIDGVIRDVGSSYRRALAETVHHYSNWRPDQASIDALKAEGRWNNDWDASLELLRRHGCPTPTRQELVALFTSFYFGGDPQGDSASWRGFIRSEPLLVNANFFAQLNAAGLAWGFVSGAEPTSARFVLEQRLGLAEPPLIAMGDAPDKPDPTGLLQLCDRLLSQQQLPVAYLGDTVADVETVQRARRQRPHQRFWSLAVAPPHLQTPDQRPSRQRYEAQLQAAGADKILNCTADVTGVVLELLS
jgi:HAD superfamily phosphatase